MDHVVYLVDAGCKLLRTLKARFQYDNFRNRRFNYLTRLMKNLFLGTQLIQ